MKPPVALPAPKFLYHDSPEFKQSQIKTWLMSLGVKREQLLPPAFVSGRKLNDEEYSQAIRASMPFLQGALESLMADPETKAMSRDDQKLKVLKIAKVAHAAGSVPLMVRVELRHLGIVPGIPLQPQQETLLRELMAGTLYRNIADDQKRAQIVQGALAAMHIPPVLQKSVQKEAA